MYKLLNYKIYDLNLHSDSESQIIAEFINLISTAASRTIKTALDIYEAEIYDAVVDSDEEHYARGLDFFFSEYHPDATCPEEIMDRIFKKTLANMIDVVCDPTDLFEFNIFEDYVLLKAVQIIQQKYIEVKSKDADKNDREYFELENYNETMLMSKIMNNIGFEPLARAFESEYDMQLTPPKLKRLIHNVTHAECFTEEAVYEISEEGDFFAVPEIPDLLFSDSFLSGLAMLVNNMPDLPVFESIQVGGWNIAEEVVLSLGCDPEVLENIKMHTDVKFFEESDDDEYDEFDEDNEPVHCILCGKQVKPTKIIPLCNTCETITKKSSDLTKSIIREKASDESLKKAHKYLDFLKENRDQIWGQDEEEKKEQSEKEDALAAELQRIFNLTKK